MMTMSLEPPAAADDDPPDEAPPDDELPHAVRLNDAKASADTPMIERRRMEENTVRLPFKGVWSEYMNWW